MSSWHPAPRVAGHSVGVVSFPIPSDVLTGDDRETRFRFSAFDDPFVKKGQDYEFYHSTSGDGRAQIWFCPFEHHPEEPDDDWPFWLCTGRVLAHWHTGTMTRRSGPLHWREPRGYVEINAEDAAAIDVLDERAVVVKSRRGQVRTKAKISERVPPGTIFLAFHWREAPANMLTQDFALDPVAKIPEYKVCAVRVENPRAKRKPKQAAVE